MKKELGITKGEWKKHKINLKDYKVVAISSNAKNTVLAHLYLEDGEITKEHLANADLIADAGTTANKTGLFPSKLLERYNEAIEALEEVNKDLIVLHGNIYQELKKGNSQWEGVDEIIFKRIEVNKQTISKAKGE